MLLACGSNGCGQLGLGHTEDIDQWTVVDTELHGPIDIRGGGNHTVIVERNTKRALISLNSIFSAVTHPHQRGWQLASAGWDFTYLVDDESKVWYTDPLGMVKGQPWAFPAPIDAICSGMKHTVVLLKNGEVYAWGGSRRGQCGVVAPEVDKPVRVEIEATLGVPVSVACGRDYTAVLCMQNENSRLVIYGDQRKFSDLVAREFPPTTGTVQSGWSHILMHGEVFGNNFCHQRELPRAKYTSATLGSEHGLLVADQTVYTWGWGEHGNCPPPHVFLGSVRVFGGCATSFVYVEQ